MFVQPSPVRGGGPGKSWRRETLAAFPLHPTEGFESPQCPRLCSARCPRAHRDSLSVPRLRPCHRWPRGGHFGGSLSPLSVWEGFLCSGSSPGGDARSCLLSARPSSPSASVNTSQPRSLQHSWVSTRGANSPPEHRDRSSQLSAGLESDKPRFWSFLSLREKGWIWDLGLPDAG